MIAWPYALESGLGIVLLLVFAGGLVARRGPAVRGMDRRSRSSRPRADLVDADSGGEWRAVHVRAGWSGPLRQAALPGRDLHRLAGGALAARAGLRPAGARVPPVRPHLAPGHARAGLRPRHDSAVRGFRADVHPALRPVGFREASG